MTRSEFEENVTCWSELLEFCHDEGCDYCDSIYTEDAKNEYFDEDLVEMARSADCWQDLYDSLGEIPTGYSYYFHDDNGEWCGADDYDFTEFKDDVLDWGDDRGIWDEEDEEDEEECRPEYEEVDEDECEDEFELDESMPLNELFAACMSEVQVITQEEEQKKRQAQEEFIELLKYAS